MATCDTRPVPLAKRWSTQAIHLLATCGILFLAGSACAPARKTFVPGDATTSSRFQGGRYMLDPDTLAGRPLLVITGNDLVLDFGDLLIDGRVPGRMPDSFSGIALFIHDSRNVTIRNIRIHGFKIAILAERVDGLTIEDCNLSYNWRPRLRSRWDREALSDWLYYHHNENREWRSYGAAIYLEDCARPTVREVTCRQGMNGLLMVRSDGGLVANNNLSFNSGVGIGLYRSGHNRIMHNRLDWNARGYSHGKYARGQDSAGILLFEQCSHNVIAYNSATHSGDGLFLWAGQHTMDTGEGGCDSNMIYANDFSHSIANAIEVTFSANAMIGNRLDDSRFGIWGGYSHHSAIQYNRMRGCETGIAIEHGRQIVIERNQISDCRSGIRLWSRDRQPADWPYAQKVDVRSREYLIRSNAFDRVKTPLDISGTTDMTVSANLVDQTPFTLPGQSSAPDSAFTDPSWATFNLTLPDPLPDGMDASLPANYPRGRRYILINEWGPFDFQYPLLALRDIRPAPAGDSLYFEILGPSGQWSLGEAEGCQLIGSSSGSLPDSLTVYCRADSIRQRIRLAFSGDQVITQLGDTLINVIDYPFGFARSNILAVWFVSFFAYDSLLDPVADPIGYNKLVSGTPDDMVQTRQLAYRWWGSPTTALPEDRFAAVARTTIQVHEGDYILDVESDDGIRIRVDGRLVLDKWSVHTPEVDEVRLHLRKGEHTIRVDYFEGGGLGVLDVGIRLAE